METTVNQRISKLIDLFTKGNKSTFAKKLGITPQSLSNYVNEQGSQPPASFFEKLKNAYPNLNLNWLLGGVGSIEDEKKNASFEELYLKIENLSKELAEERRERIIWQEEARSVNKKYTALMEKMLAGQWNKMEVADELTKYRTKQAGSRMSDSTATF